MAKQNLFDVKTVPTNPFVIGSELQKGNPAAITYDNGGIQHTVGMIIVMDPLYRTYQRLSFQSFNIGVVRVVKPWKLLCTNSLF